MIKQSHVEPKRSKLLYTFSLYDCRQIKFLKSLVPCRKSAYTQSNRLTFTSQSKLGVRVDHDWGKNGKVGRTDGPTKGSPDPGPVPRKGLPGGETRPSSGKRSSVYCLGCGWDRSFTAFIVEDVLQKKSRGRINKREGKDDVTSLETSIVTQMLHLSGEWSRHWTSFTGLERRVCKGVHFYLI